MKKYFIVTAILLLMLSIPTPSKAVEFDADVAYSYLLTQCAFGPRNPGSEGYAECLDWFIEHLEQLSCEVYRHRFTATEALTGKQHNMTNIIARFEGTSDVPALALCAHWDTRAHADLDPDPANRETPISGANDGASGVAVLLEIARLASENPPPRPLLIILFDGEDMGRSTHAEEFALGSKAWAQDMIPEKPSQAILLDMIGDSDLELAKELFSMANCEGFQDYLWSLADELGLDTFKDEPGPAVSDDHVPLIAKGIEAIDIIDFEYPYWHTLEDTPDKCSPESLSQTGRLITAFIWGIE